MIGYAAGECNYYPKKKLETIVHYTKPLFERWDESAYRNYMQLFELDDQKKLCELSCGMRVKFSLVLALSHHARLLILDEPTSGLDPLMQREFYALLRERNQGGATVFLSSHVLSEIQRYCRSAEAKCDEVSAAAVSAKPASTNAAARSSDSAMVEHAP